MENLLCNTCSEHRIFDTKAWREFGEPMEIACPVTRKLIDGPLPFKRVDCGRYLKEFRQYSQSGCDIHLRVALFPKQYEKMYNKLADDQKLEWLCNVVTLNQNLNL